MRPPAPHSRAGTTPHGPRSPGDALLPRSHIRLGQRNLSPRRGSRATVRCHAQRKERTRRCRRYRESGSRPEPPDPSPVANSRLCAPRPLADPPQHFARLPVCPSHGPACSPNSTSPPNQAIDLQPRPTGQPQPHRHRNDHWTVTPIFALAKTQEPHYKPCELRRTQASLAREKGTISKSHALLVGPRVENAGYGDVPSPLPTTVAV